MIFETLLEKENRSSFPRRRESNSNQNNNVKSKYYIHLIWIPAYAGMTKWLFYRMRQSCSQRATHHHHGRSVGAAGRRRVLAHFRLPVFILLIF